MASEMKTYPKFTEKNSKDIIEILEFIIKERKNDVNDFTNLKNVFISGRKVAKIPTGSLDVTDTDRVGDFNYDLSSLYILVDNGGSAEWRQAMLSAF